jgi:aspartate-semialdehyde dehydrogenase
MSEVFNIAVVGITSLVGEAVLSLLGERELPLGEVYALESGEVGTNRVPFKETYLQPQEVAVFDFSQVDVAIFCGGDAVSAEYVPKATAAGCIVVDDSSCFRLDDDVPLVVPEVNPEAIAQFEQRRIIANPNSCATLMSLVLKPIVDAVGIDRVNVVTFQSASGCDKAGVEELAQQSTALFNMNPIKAKVFGKQIAFNVLPQIGELQENGYTHEEMKLLQETQKILTNEEVSVNATTVRVPVFHGHAMALHVETNKKMSADEATLRLTQQEGVEVLEGDYPTPVTEASGQDSVFVGRIREDLSHSNGLDLWVVADNVRKGAALNSVQIVEILIKDYLS